MELSDHSVFATTQELHSEADGNEQTALEQLLVTNTKREGHNWVVATHNRCVHALSALGICVSMMVRYLAAARLRRLLPPLFCQARVIVCWCSLGQHGSA